MTAEAGLPIDIMNININIHVYGITQRALCMFTGRPTTEAKFERPHYYSNCKTCY